MPLRIEPWNEENFAARIGAMVANDAMQPEFERLLGTGVAEVMGDAFNPPEHRRLATLDGRDAGFAIAFVLPTASRPFASIRVGVTEAARRRGIGTVLYREVTASLLARIPDLAEIESSAFLPNPAAEAFLAALGLTPVRKYWLMERPGREAPAPDWPAEITIRSFDGSERDLERWCDVINRSWQEQDHGVLATVPDLRALLASGTFKAEGMHFAIAGGEPVGFVRGAEFHLRGEVAVLGVLPEWRGRGLGRALLRFGTRWLLDRGSPRVTLTVDGQNERALTLYRQEQYEVIQTRQIFSRRL